MNFIPKMKKETLIDGYQHIYTQFTPPRLIMKELPLSSRNFTRIMKVSIDKLKWSHYRRPF